ncbi:hypothetical protein SARC_05666 [Sphaeroforma arctica JP610]|uniref:BPL/LPL catalytic domain-containing protein n=1 Tax=Sphaeroforma arctica JP610 TaxID=667725 RepID=A0A0L0FZJ6_9EUKA|nr:hypothetical protein SARC_05666 [Sphaeroforma arctica JP610]KNC82049.1 hypothetical protein SARC_05666 [Sphaeroforma arctica JP610]|eukprot:XP_014155951.1 hypothetical protein SARC_05666 [Sphaeroforma arctica JP610]
MLSGSKVVLPGLPILRSQSRVGCRTTNVVLKVKASTAMRSICTAVCMSRIERYTSRNCITTRPMRTHSYDSKTYLQSQWSNIQRCSGCAYSVAARPAMKVYRSTSIDPYANLALEDWMYTQWGRPNSTARDVLGVDDMQSDSCVLLFWVDEPSVVIGRNQNPWTECDVSGMHRDHVHFVRRKSGGGTVYHDSGNLNISLVTGRDAYTKHRLTRVIATALNRDFKLGVYVNDRNDLAINGKKVSGSAYKLGGRCAYHHCTLLTTTDIKSVGKYLHSDREGIVDSRGVSSVRSPVSALCDHMPGDGSLTIDAVIDSITRELGQHVLEGGLSGNEVNSYNSEGERGNVNSNDVGSTTVHQSVSSTTHQPEEINPETDMAVGEWCKQYRDTLVGWDWQYGQTPQFTQQVRRVFPWGTAALTLSCKRGVVESVTTEFGELQDSSTLSATVGNVKAKHEAISQEIRNVCVNTRYAVQSDMLVARRSWLASAGATDLSQTEQTRVADLLDCLVDIYTI